MSQPTFTDPEAVPIFDAALEQAKRAIDVQDEGKGTKHDIDLALEKRKPLRVFFPKV